MKTKNPVVHFEMPAQDLQRMATFYTNVFGWQIQSFGPPEGNYMVAATAETDADGRPVMPGAINGGFYLQPKNEPAHPSVVIAVDDIKQAMKDITAAGGKLIGEPADIPGVGSYISFTDPEGNRVSILQPSMK